MPDSTVRRDAAATTQKLAYAGGALVFAIVLWASDQKFWAVVVGLGAIVIAVTAFQDSGIATCPIDGTTLSVGSGLNECPKCRHFFENQAGKLREIDHDTVKGLPFFGIPWAEISDHMPPLCCACGAPATRTVAVRMETPLGTGVITTRAARFSIEMPHCASHENGADIGSDSRRRAMDDPKRTVTDDSESFLAIRVRSYAFYRAFMRLSGKPGFEDQTMIAR